MDYLPQPLTLLLLGLGLLSQKLKKVYPKIRYGKTTREIVTKYFNLSNLLPLPKQKQSWLLRLLAQKSSHRSSYTSLDATPSSCSYP